MKLASASYVKQQTRGLATFLAHCGRRSLDGALTIVVIEDDPDIRSVVTLALGLDALIRVIVFASGAAAVAALTLLSQPVDGLMLDVHLPDVNGLDLLDQLRSIPTLAAVPAIFMTASVRPEELAKYERAGAVGTVSKPFDPISLAGQVRRLFGRLR